MALPIGSPRFFKESSELALTRLEQFAIRDLAAHIAMGRALSLTGDPHAIAKRIGDDLPRFMMFHHITGIPTAKAAAGNEFLIEAAQTFLASSAHGPAAAFGAATHDRFYRKRN